MVDITRERLFELVWSMPATEVARELGVSDVMVAKLCKSLQVPKPPRGYWARRAAGRAPRRPPLPAFRESSSPRRPKAAGPGLYLSPRQRELLEHAYEHVAKGMASPAELVIRNERLVSIDADLAAAIVIATGRSYRRWLFPDGPPNSQAESAAQRTAGKLIEALLPHARPRIVVFSPPQPAWADPSRAPELQVLVHFTADLVRTVAGLANIVREQRLAFVARGLGAAEHHWQARVVVGEDRFAAGETLLCVGRREVWIRYTGRHSLDDSGEVIETERVPLEAIAPMDLLSHVAIDVTSVGQRVSQRRYLERLRRLLEAEQALEIAGEAYVGVHEDALAGSLSQLLSLWHLPDEGEAVRSVRHALTDIGDRLEQWSDSLDREREALCAAILGISPGDAVSICGPGGRETLLLDRLHVHVHDERGEVCFYVEGRRYRKDGLPGKRREFKVISVPWPKGTRR